MLGLLVVAILIAVYVYNYYEGVKRYRFLHYCAYRRCLSLIDVFPYNK